MKSTKHTLIPSLNISAWSLTQTGRRLFVTSVPRKVIRTKMKSAQTFLHWPKAEKQKKFIAMIAGNWYKCSIKLMENNWFYIYFWLVVTFKCEFKIKIVSKTQEFTFHTFCFDYSLIAFSSISFCSGNPPKLRHRSKPLISTLAYTTNHFLAPDCVKWN